MKYYNYTIPYKELPMYIAGVVDPKGFVEDNLEYPEPCCDEYVPFEEWLVWESGF